MATVLKKRHSMKEKDLFPIIEQVERQTEIIPVTDLARLRVDRCLSSYSIDQLAIEFEKLTGWNMRLVLSREHRTIHKFRHLVHLTILQANTVGAPAIQTGDILFQKHTLIEKSLRPVIRKVRNQKENIQDADLARITEDRNLSSYTIEELSMEFEGLTGWSVGIVLSQAHQKRNLQNVRHLVHFTILQANEVGAPPSKIGVVLKKGHSLIGKSLDPVITKVEAQGEVIPDTELARLEKDICLTSYSLKELCDKFERLTEWPVKVVMPQARRYLNLKNVRHLVHFTILEANIKGAPRAMAFNRSFKE